MSGEPRLPNRTLTLSAPGNPLVSLNVITTLLVTCFAAITGYCLVVAWPKLKTVGRAQRPQARVDRSAHELRSNSTARPTLLKR
jgi:hypothetical protein